MVIDDFPTLFIRANQGHTIKKIDENKLLDLNYIDTFIDNDPSKSIIN